MIKPRRSVLSVPGHIQKMHIKAEATDADIIMFDLEDSVPADKKDEARELVADTIPSFNAGRKSISVRINPAGTRFCYRDIIHLAEKCGGFIDSFVMPKVEHVAEVHFADLLLKSIEDQIGRELSIGLEPSVESAAGLENISSIAAGSKRNKALVFGIADFSASIGARLRSVSGHGENEEDIYPGHRWQYVLSAMVTAAKARGLQVIDAPYGNFKDPAGLRKSAALSAALGCDGKWAIHPSQVDIINEVYSPLPEEIENASRILEAHEISLKEGKGAISLDGKMIDHATIRMAKELWEKARLLGLV